MQPQSLTRSPLTLITKRSSHVNEAIHRKPADSMREPVGKFENQEFLLLKFPEGLFNGSPSNFAIPSINWGGSSSLTDSKGAS
jgi:hypothetical protein